MKGTILDFSVQSNTGVISGDNELRYHFIGNEWKEQLAPQRGMSVDFDSNEQGQALSIYLALDAKVGSPTSATQNQSIKTEEQYQFIDWFMKGLKNYANFNGRASRKEFWFFMLGKYLLLLILLTIDAILDTDGMLCILGILALAIPEWSAGCRRLHDIGKTGWLQLLAVIPFGLILLVIWWTKNSEPQNNQYGDIPLSAS